MQRPNPKVLALAVQQLCFLKQGAVIRRNPIGVQDAAIGMNAVAEHKKKGLPTYGKTRAYCPIRRAQRPWLSFHGIEILYDQRLPSAYRSKPSDKVRLVNFVLLVDQVFWPKPTPLFATYT